MRTTLRRCIELTLATLCVCIGIARADGNDMRAPGLVLISGNGAESHRATVTIAIETAVRQAGWSLPSKQLTKKESDSLYACFDTKTPSTCTAGSPSPARVFVVTIENGQATNGAPMLVLTGKGIVVEPRSVTVWQQFCERCADDKLAAASTELARLVLRDLALRSERTILQIKSVPTGAEIVLDGQRIGATDATFNTFPGKHVVVIEKPGYLAETRELVAVEGKTAEIAVTLRASSVGEVPGVEPPSKVLPIALIVGGGALVVAGGISMYYGSLDGPDEKYNYTNATAIGIGTGLVGIGAAAVGAYLWWRGSRSSAPTVHATSTGVAFGWAGTFR